MIYSMSKLREKEVKSEKSRRKEEKLKHKKEETKSPKTSATAAIAKSAKPSSKKAAKKSLFSDDSAGGGGTDTDDSIAASLAAKSTKKSSGNKDKVKKEKQPPQLIRNRGSSLDSEEEVSRQSQESEHSSLDSDASMKDASASSNKNKQLIKQKKIGVSPKQSKTSSMKVERPNTRKQARGSTVKKSVHVTGRKDDSESESDQEERGKSPSKRSTRPTLPKSTKARPEYDPIERRNCPVPGCDSRGHLSGKLDRHFTHDACPLYHNTSQQECRERMKEYMRKDTARRKAGARSPLLSPSNEQKRYQEKIAAQRRMDDDYPSQEEDEDDIGITDKERTIKGLTSEFDLALFREAQAKASDKIENQLKGLPDVKGTKYIEMGRFQIEVWYQSPYPDEYTVLPKIYICEFCLKYMKAYSVMKRHLTKCVWRHPPGDEIYRKDKLSVFEVCGKKYKQYCQNLCLIAKSFLDHKTLYYDVEPFLFYVMTTADSEGCHIVGYFSKEKNSVLNYNVSCILTLPPYQRQGYGRLLIDFSYLLSKMEGKIGSPEKPLSDLGLISYRAYWKDILLDYLTRDTWVVSDREISIKAISEEMGIQSYDIISTLQFLGMIKYWRGKHIILKKEDIINQYLERMRRRPRDKEITGVHLKWKPYEPTTKEKRQRLEIQLKWKKGLTK